MFGVHAKSALKLIQIIKPTSADSLLLWIALADGTRSGYGSAFEG